MSLSIFQFGLGACLTDLYLCATAGNEMVPSMALLSFPAGLLALLFASPLVQGGTPEGYLVTWFSMFVAGYVQWFIVVPKLRGPHLITLGLSAATELNQTDSKVMESVPTRPAKSGCRRRRSIPAYDRHGLTPLERAIKARRR